MVLVR
jgi:hypothetical protein